MNDSFCIPEYRSGLKDMFVQFIQYKKSSGRKERLYATVLNSFDTYCVSLSRKVNTLDRDTVDGFLQVTDQRKLSSVLKNASVLRELGRYMHRTGIKDAYITNLHGSRKSTYTPYIFNREQIFLILQKASGFHSCYDSVNPNMKNTISCLYAMLYCTGIRISEALSLKLLEVSLTERTILVTESKSGRQRLLPISASLSLKCGEYLSKRCSCHNVYFFDSGSSLHDGQINTRTAYRYFRVLMEESGIIHRGRGNGPRLHDFRDTFAVHSLQQLIEQGGDVNAGLEYLSLYMGHRSIYETQDYLWLTEELAEDMLNKTSGSAAFLAEEYRRKAVALDV